MKPPLERTHDISPANYHIKDLAAFGQTLTCATAAVFPNEVPVGRSRYNRVHALFLSWEDDLLGVSREIADLRDVLRHKYHYETEEWHIPSSRSHNSLVKRISEFLEAYEDNKTLLIVYYAGHGHLNDDRQLVGACHATSDSPTMKWLGIQNMLEQAESDVLILLDCCAGASSAAEAGNGVTEVIAACGFDTWAPCVSEHSFTRNLIDELHYWCGTPYSVATLHMRVLAAMKHWKPRFSRTSNEERRKTPIHSLLNCQGQSRSIQLIPLRPQSALIAELPASRFEAPSSESSGSHSGSHGLHDGNDLDSSQSSNSHVWSDPDFRTPKVLISLSLEEDQELSPNAWAEWLASIPAKIESACVEGVYRSYSTLVLLSVPVATWDMLPESPAVNFIGFVRSDDLLQNVPLKTTLGQCSTTGQAHTLPTSRDSPLNRVQDRRNIFKNPTTPARRRTSPGSRQGLVKPNDEDFDELTDKLPSGYPRSSSASSTRSGSTFAGTDSTGASSVYSGHHASTASRKTPLARVSEELDFDYPTRSSHDDRANSKNDYRADREDDYRYYAQSSYYR